MRPTRAFALRVYLPASRPVDSLGMTSVPLDKPVRFLHEAMKEKEEGGGGVEATRAASPAIKKGQAGPEGEAAKPEGRYGDAGAWT